MLDPGFLARLNFTRARAAQLAGKLRLTHREWAELVVANGGEALKDSSWSQIFALKQPFSAATATAMARAGGVPVGWLLANEGEAPAGFIEPPAPPPSAFKPVPRSSKSAARPRRRSNG